MSRPFNYLYYVNVLCCAAALKDKEITPNMIRHLVTELEEMSPDERTQFIRKMAKDDDCRHAALNLRYMRKYPPRRVDKKKLQQFLANEEQQQKDAEAIVKELMEDHNKTKD